MAGNCCILGRSMRGGDKVSVSKYLETHFAQQRDCCCRSLGLAFGVISLSLSWHYNKMPFQSLLTKCTDYELESSLSFIPSLLHSVNLPRSIRFSPPQGRAPPSFGNFSTGISKHNNASKQKQNQDQSKDQDARKPQSLKKDIKSGFFTLRKTIFIFEVFVVRA